MNATRMSRTTSKPHGCMARVQGYAYFDSQNVSLVLLLVEYVRKRTSFFSPIYQTSIERASVSMTVV